MSEFDDDTYADRFYDRDGNPISLLRWGELSQDRDYKQLRATTLRDGTVISTIWMGLDHSLWGKPPLIFETLVFPASSWNADWMENEGYRYPTEAAALAHHDQLIAKYNEAYDRLQAALNEIEGSDRGVE